jgi:hypothetical protein
MKRRKFPAVVTVGEKSRFVLFLADTGAPTPFMSHEHEGCGLVVNPESGQKHLIACKPSAFTRMAGGSVTLPVPFRQKS